MTKNKKKKSKNKPLSTKNYDKVITFPGRVYALGAVANGGVVVLSHLDFSIANLDSRAIAVAKLYKLWKLTKLHISQFVLYNTSATNDLVVQHVLSWTPLPFVSFTSAPTVFGDLLDFPSSNIDAGIRKITFNIPNAQLMSSHTSKWLYTQQISGITPDEWSAGTIWSGITSFSGDTNSSAHIVISYVLQFKEPTDPAVLIGGHSNELTFSSSITVPSSPSPGEWIDSSFEEKVHQLTKHVLSSNSKMKVEQKK
jgi:hypothetical protein